MRNRTPLGGGGKIRSPPNKRADDDDKYHHHHNSRTNVRCMMILLSLGLLGCFFYSKERGNDIHISVGTIPPVNKNSIPVNKNSMRRMAQQEAARREAAKAHPEKDPVRLPQADKKETPKGIKGAKNLNVHQAKNGKRIVRDRDGDIVEDDMLAKDIMAGNEVEVPVIVDNELDLVRGENRWQHSQTIPDWLKEYFEWHQQVAPTIDRSTWQQYNYLVMTCLGGEVCGNVAHRLRPIMAFLRVAAESKRIFYIHWDLPDRLEKYLQPPDHGGINWTVPEAVMWRVRKSLWQNEIPIILQQAFKEDRRMVNVMFNDDTFAEPYYDAHRKAGEKTAAEALKDTWDVLFRPTSMTMTRANEKMHIIGYEPGEYASAHIDYEIVPETHAEHEELRLKVEHAMNCLSQLRPGGPFLVAAQTYDIAREALVYAKHHNVKVHAKQIDHDSSKVPLDLFNSFVEIMYMSNSRCVAYNRAGYGQLGYLLGYDYNCRIKYTTTDCKWTDPPPASQE
jgi:hypothetical protein